MRFGTVESDSERPSVVTLRYRIETVGESEIAVVDRGSVGNWCLLRSSKVNVNGEIEVIRKEQCCSIQSARETSRDLR